MHKKGKKLKSVPVQPKAKHFAKTWKKYAILAGTALGLGLIGIDIYLSAKIASTPPKLPPKISSIAAKEEKIQTILSRYAISNSEIKRIINTTDYDIVILSQFSNALQRISGQNINGANIALIKNKGQFRCFFIIRPLQDSQISLRYDANAGKLKQNLKELLEQTAESSNLRDRVLLFERTMGIAKNLSSKEPDKEILTFFILEEIIQIRINAVKTIQDQRRDNLVDTALHEAVHGEFNRDIVRKNPTVYKLKDEDILILNSSNAFVLNMEENEKLARLATLAYSQNPLPLLRDLIAKSSLELITSPKRDSYCLVKGLFTALGIFDNPLALLDKSDLEIGAVAKQLLEKFSIELYGSAFNLVVDVNRLQEVQKLVSDYLDQNQGNL